MNTIFVILYILIFIIISLVMFAIFQLQLAGIKIKDFWNFVEANQVLDKLYEICNIYDKLTPQEQLIYLMEAEKVFDAFEKIPEPLWEEEHVKYSEVLDKYKDIKMLRWNEIH